jgi:hypothetical protein
MWNTVIRLAAGLSVPVLLAGSAQPAAAQDRVVITAPELARSGASTVYDAIRRLRPQLLRSRPSDYLLYFTERRPAVAVNEEVKGGLEVLQDMPVGEVAHVEYFDARGAKQRYGIEAADGLVLVVKAPALADAPSPR